jgi:hypothetical protein
VKAKLSVYPEGSVRVSENDPTGSYTKLVGSLIGHDVNQCKEVSWILRCKEPCNSTITVTITGEDEYGYEVKQICASVIKHEHQITCCELVLDGTPLSAIPDRFIMDDSVTVKQSEDGVDPPAGDGSVTVQLEQGWNLVSMPWYIEPGDRDSEVLLADILDTLDGAYKYDRCGDTWMAFFPADMSNPPSDLQTMRDGPGFWFYMNEAEELTVEGSISPEGGTPPEYAIDCPGWHLIGPRIGENPTTVGAWMSNCSATYGSTMLGYDNGTWIVVDSTSDMIVPGQGYWVFFTSTGTRSQ